MIINCRLEIYSPVEYFLLTPKKYKIEEIYNHLNISN